MLSQEALGRAYVQFARRLDEAIAPVATPLSEALRQLERSVGPVMRRLKEWSDAVAPHLQAFRALAVLVFFGFLSE